MIIRFPKKVRETFLLDHFKSTLLWTLLAVIACYFFIDLPLTTHVALLHPGLKATAQNISNLIDPKFQLFIWPVLYFLFRFIYKREILGNRCLLVLMSIAVSNVLAEIIKKLLGRARPELFFSHGQYGFTLLNASNLYSSFPSGHACTIGAICGAFACLYPRLWVPLLILSFLMASTRIVLNVHFLSDVIAGTILGFMMAQWIYKMMKKEQVPLSRRFYGTPF